MAVKVVLGIVAILAVAQTAVLGVKGGIGPLGFIRKKRLSALVGNSERYDMSAVEPLASSPLAGKKVAVLGSSVVYGAASEQQAVGEYLAARFGCEVTKEAVSGTTLVDGRNSYIKRLKARLPKDAGYELFICQLSTNDATMKKPLGRISDGEALEAFDTSTVTGALEYITVYARETWGCPVAFFTGSRFDSREYGDMVIRLNELAEKYEVCVLDLWGSDEFNDISDDARSLYMSDAIHPTKAGYRDWWGPELERQLLIYLDR